MPRTTPWTARAVLLAASGALLSCTDVPTETNRGPGRVIEQLVGCRVEVATGQTQCEALGPDGARQGGPARNLIADAQWMVETEAGAYTPADSTYRFNLRVTNDTDAALGTSDGVQATGLKVFLPVRVMGYTGRPAGDTSDPYGILIPAIKNTNTSVRPRNPDGVASFTAADQPYWNYPEILQPGATSHWREWQFTLQPNVAYFYFAVSIFTHAAGEQAVSAEAPDGWLIPRDSAALLLAPQNLIIDHPRVSGPYPRNVVLLAFDSAATSDEKQAAVDRIGGTVVGGDGAHYYVKVTNGSEPVWQAIDQLAGLPQVEDALPYLFANTASYRRPNNGASWRRGDWQVHPDSAHGLNWGPEAVGAPGAWGCETGSTAVKVAVVDVEPTHASQVAAVFFGPGDTGAGMTGVMWNGDMVVTDASVGTGTPDDYLRQDLKAAILRRSTVINLSWVAAYWDALGNPRDPVAGSTADINHAQSYFRMWQRRMRRYERAASPDHHPLYVLAAGNYGVDASYSGLPRLAADPRFANRVLVVAAHDSLRSGSTWTVPGFSSNGSLPVIAAPGASLHIRTAAGDYPNIGGTSFAAPHVSGIAGLLFSQLPSRTPQKVREYVLAGAVRGGRRAGAYPIANAYESLRRGAEDAGAPLCGNRIWADGAQLKVQRGTGAAESLGPAEAGGGIVDILTQHGGRVVLYNNTAAQGRAMVRQADGTWALGTVPPDYPSRIGGATWSVNSASHDTDTVIVSVARTSNINDNMWWRTGDQNSVAIWKQMGPSAFQQLGRINVADLPQPQGDICVERVPNSTSCTFTQLSGRYWMFRYAYPQAYQPILITITPVQTVFVDSTAWIPCTRDPGLQCRRAKSELRWAATTVYRIPLSGGAPQLVDSLQNTVFWIGQSEAAGSDTLVMGRGKWIIESWFEPNTRSQETTRSEVESCAIEYRSLAAITTIGQAIQNPNVCFWSSVSQIENSGGGSMSPLIAGDSRPAPPMPGRTTVDVRGMIEAARIRRR